MQWQSNYQQQSKFNSAIIKIKRMNAVWGNIHRCVRTGDMGAMEWELDIAWAELEADTSKPQLDEYNKINKEISEVKNRNSKNLKEYRDKKSGVYQALLKKWIFLFKIEKHQGWRTAYYDPAEEELD